MNQQSPIERIVNSKFYPLLLFFVSFVFVTLFSRSTSFLYITEGSDPSLFKSMGMAILKGHTLYINYFDNKGYILYFIYALGVWLGGNLPLLLMQSLSLTITLIIWDKMLALYRDEHFRFIGLAVALLLLLCFYTEGGLTQEWCLPLASYPLLIYFRSLKTKQEIHSLQMFTIGLCFGIITFIQINNATPFLGFLAYIWIRQLLEKRINNFISSLMCFILGLLPIVIISVLYFYLKAGWHGVYEMVYASFLSNFEYLSAISHSHIHYVVFYFLFLISFLFFSIISCQDKKVLIPLLLSTAMFIVSYGKLCHIYYLMAFVPLCVVGFMTFDFSEKKKLKIVLVGLSSISLIFYIIKPLHLLVNDLILGNEKEVAIYRDFHNFVESIPEEEHDSIYNYNLNSYGTSMMQHEGLLQCNRVLFSTLAFKLPKLHEEEVNKSFSAPLWIMISWKKTYKKNDAYFILNNYELKYSFIYDRIYLTKPKIGKAFEICLYRRKDPVPAP